MKIKIKRLNKEIELPKHQRKGDAAIDIRASENVIIKSGERKVVKSGIAIELPEGYAGLVWDRGGMAANHGIHTMAGVLDSNYRGELMIVLKNLSEKDFEIKMGDRIAQLLVQKVENVEVEEVENLSESERNEARFMSSGK
ncbi:dUTP diphosphatase [Candidatus Pacearchaeota archaeon]|nr:dUTP diphosphatase [Candidatus Pacearchaeota archaeon]